MIYMCVRACVCVCECVFKCGVKLDTMIPISKTKSKNCSGDYMLVRFNTCETVYSYLLISTLINLLLCMSYLIIYIYSNLSIVLQRTETLTKWRIFTHNFY